MDAVLRYAWLIPVFPLLGAIVNGLVGKRLGRSFVGTVAVASVGAAFLWSVLVFWALRVLPDPLYQRDLFVWIPMGHPDGGILPGGFDATVGYLIDPLSTLMILVVTGVGLLIHIYSVGYMKREPDFSRYFAYLNLFAASMLTLVLANNFLLMFVGWEGVGLCSYLLIGFWFERRSAAAAGKKAFIINRVGDFGFVLGILLLFSIFGTLRFTDVNAQAGALYLQGMLTAGAVTLITLLLFVGAAGKSAQLPLWVWLPDAMEGPTPVSALIHAATMVTSGVYLIARTNALWALAPYSAAVVAIVGAATALFAATIALTQYDLKRILAYSTISQLGLMFLAVGVGAYTAGVFHLMTHAFFKALLFLGAGSIMHALGNVIDLRQMGQLRRFMPATYKTFTIGWLAIAGFPLLAGWWSKDEILAATVMQGTGLGYGLYAAGLLASLLTALYMSRAYYLAFHSDKRLDRHTEERVHESPASITTPLWILAGLSVAGGIVFALPMLWGNYHTPIANFLDPVWAPARAIAGEPHHAAGLTLAGLMLIATAVALLGIWLGRRAYKELAFAAPEPAERQLGSAWGFFEEKWHIEKAYQAVFVRGGTRLSEWLVGPVDRGVDRAVDGVGEVVAGLGEVLRRWQTGFVRSYALSVLAGVVVIVAYFVLR